MTLRRVEHLRRGCSRLQLQLRLRLCVCHAATQRLRQALPGHDNNLGAALQVQPIAMLAQRLSSAGRDEEEAGKGECIVDSISYLLTFSVVTFIGFFRCILALSLDSTCVATVTVFGSSMRCFSNSSCLHSISFCSNSTQLKIISL